MTVCDDYDGLARVTHALKMPIAGGEYVYGIAPFRQMLEARSVDIVMIDLLRAGGITQWMKIAGMAEAFNMPVVSHLIPEVHVHLIAAIPNGEIVEYMPWTRNLFDKCPLPEKSTMAVPSEPGLWSFSSRKKSLHGSTLGGREQVVRLMDRRCRFTMR